MIKTNAQNINSSLPALVTNVGNYIKSVVSLDKQKDTITNASGTIGFFISLLGKPLIDGYFEQQTKDKLEDYGFKTYLRAAFHQAENSLHEILHLITDDIDLKAVTIGVEKNVFDNINRLEKELSILVFQPKYHPAVVFVKDLIVNTFSDLGISHDLITTFRNNFNRNIEAAASSEFGEESYKKHKTNIEALWFEQSETELLLDSVNQRRIGFTAKEELKYEAAYGSWAPIHKGFSSENNEDQADIEQIETLEETLVPVDELIEEYFTSQSNNPSNHLEKILFIIADFGKGKSVFLKNYAGQLAEQYLATGEGHIPIYFNLRNFANYAHDSQFGVIEDFLLTEYAIKINSEYFINKRYCFLIDSLDESCDLSKANIEKVIASIKRIQNLDKTKYRTNRVVITSRPFDIVLYSQISSHKPHPLSVEDKIKEHYISIYGFKKNQFNDWIYTSLSNIQDDANLDHSDGVIQNIISQIKQGNAIDVYNLLLNNETLSVSELRRPIFAYMIYKLLTNNINITKTGKIGIYLSFLNLLSKEAKYIYDPNYQISLLEQYEARNILHLTSALWNYQKQNGKQGSLKKADLCRIMDQSLSNEPDDRILDRFRNNNLNQIEFLSHSYFGEQSNILHFQHQSFAEILLAEYYLKVIIKYALDRNYNLDIVTSKLMLGTPTKQTIQFLSEILVLVRDTVSDNPSSEIIEKRKLILPLLASISIDTNNPSLYSDRLYYEWFSKANITKQTVELPEILLQDWCLSSSTVNYINNLCKQVIESRSKLVLSKSNAFTSLYDKEVSLLSNRNADTSSFEPKFLCLIIGNKLCPERSFEFIQSIDKGIIMDLLRESNNYSNYPFIKSQFQGFQFRDDIGQVLYTSLLSSMEFYDYNFSYCLFEKVTISNCYFYSCYFNETIFNGVAFFSCNFSNCNLNTLTLKDVFYSFATSFSYGLTPPNKLSLKLIEKIWNDDTKFFLHEKETLKSMVEDSVDYKLIIKEERHMSDVINSFGFIIRYCIMNDCISLLEVLDLFNFEKKFKEEGEYALTLWYKKQKSPIDLN